MKIEILEGLIPATFTPMHQNASLNLDAIDAYYAMLCKNGVKAIFICGTTGEGELLTMEERKLVAEKWLSVSKNNDAFKVITVVGSNRITEAIELAKHAEANGSYGISYIAPYYYKPATIDALVDCCVQVSEAVPHLPFYYYHIPILTNVKFAMIDFLVAAKSRIKNLAGVKYSDEDLVDYSKCLAFENGIYNVFWGKDETLVSALSMGAKSAIGSTYNYISPLYNEIIKAYHSSNNENATSLQWKSVEIVNLLSKYTGLSTGKYFMKTIGVDCGPSRNPLRNLSEKEIELLEKDLTAVGFSKYSMK